MSCIQLTIDTINIKQVYPILGSFIGFEEDVVLPYTEEDVDPID